MNPNKVLKNIFNNCFFILNASSVFHCLLKIKLIQLSLFQIINRDNGLPIPTSSYVPQNANIKPDAEVTIELSEGEAYIGAGVLFKGFVINGGIPVPTS